ncbi:MAG: mevalonate kinase [Myxococcota bacterium]
MDRSDNAVEGRGKVILLGEHGVVYGHPAIAMSIDRGVRATAALATQDLLTVEPWQVAITPRLLDEGSTDSTSAEDAAQTEPQSLLASALAHVLASYPEDRPSVHLHAEVSLPAGAGLGCSAALGVAIIRAIDACIGVARSDVQVAQAALVWEKVFHGNPSGIDHQMSARGGIGVFQRAQGFEEVSSRRPITLVVAHSEETSSTKAMVAHVARLRTREPQSVDKTFEAIAALVRNGRLAIESNDWSTLGTLMDLNQALLNSLMLSTSRLEEMCLAARDSGAYGAKLTGAGGGGCMVALVEPNDAPRVLAALEPAPAFIVSSSRVASSSDEDEPAFRSRPSDSETNG